MPLYRLEFETVLPFSQGLHFYNGENPICRPEDVPDEYWTPTSRETDNLWQQYNQLKRWAETGEQLIRNVKLSKAIAPIEWTPCDDERSAS